MFVYFFCMYYDFLNLCIPHDNIRRKNGTGLIVLSKCDPNYQLLKEIAIVLCFQLCYTALQMKTITRRISAINPVTTESSDDFHYKHREAIMRCYSELTPYAFNKCKWDTKEDTGKVHKACIVCAAVYAKKHLLAKAMLNSKKKSSLYP